MTVRKAIARVAFEARQLVYLSSALLAAITAASRFPVRFARSERAYLVGVVCGANPERKLKLVWLTGWLLAAARELDAWAA